jgi:hypothetical protein
LTSIEPKIRWRYLPGRMWNLKGSGKLQTKIDKLKIKPMKKTIKKIRTYLEKFKDQDGNDPDMMIIASLFQLYTEAYIKMHRLEKRNKD